MSGFADTLRAGSVRISRWFAWGGGALILASAALITLDVVFRNLTKSTFFESFELSGYAFAISTSFGLAFAFFSKAHIRIEVLYNLLPRKARAWLDVASVLVLAVIALVLAYWCAQAMLQNVSSGARSNSTLGLRIAIPQAIWLAGLAWFAFVVTTTGLVALARAASGRTDKVTAELGVSTLDEEISASVDAPLAAQHTTGSRG
jgi:TRAP-type C4-dicarboxylate transport system permease small subunit